MTEAERQAAIAHMNADHADAVLLYAQVFGRIPGATDATMTDLDQHAMRLLVETADGPRRVTVPLSSEARSLASARDVLVDMARDAKAKAASL